MIHIEGEEDMMLNEDSSKQVDEDDQDEESESADNLNEDEKQDKYVKGFLKELNKVGPFSK